MARGAMGWISEAGTSMHGYCSVQRPNSVTEDLFHIIRRLITLDIGVFEVELEGSDFICGKPYSEFHILDVGL